MKKKRLSKWNMPSGKLVQIKDTLPPPSELIMPDETLKVTIVLNKSTVIFFKKQAIRHKTKYQKMIREVLDRYTAQYKAA